MPNYSGIYSGVRYIWNPASETDTIDDLFNRLTENNQQDSVVGAVMFPSKFFSADNSNIIPTQLMDIPRPTKLDGYTPRNKKLLTFPFCYLCVDTLNDSHNYRWEWFNDPTEASFLIEAAVSCTPEIACQPIGYNGGSIATEEVIMTGFPQVAFTVDTYRAWVAQKSLGEVSSFIGQGMGTIASVGTGNLIGGVLGIAGMAHSYAAMQVESSAGNRVRGNQGASADVASGAKDFYFKTMTCSSEYAEMIDGFFDRYGYSCCKLKIPNRNVRLQHTYTKTQNCNLYGNVPVDDMAKIASIYDKGITFWRNPANVGNYSLSNVPG